MSTDRDTLLTNLIGIGFVPAVKASTLHVGDVTVWNYGYTEEIVEITPRGKTQMFLKVRSTGNRGNRPNSTLISHRTVSINRAVVVQWW